jgi:hypothetical protein
MSTDTGSSEVRWATGGVAFAAILAIIVGGFHIVAGVSAISKDEFFVVTRNYVFGMDITAWGGLHLILGIFVATAGCFLLARSAWAGLVVIFLAALSALESFFFLPYYPVYSLLVIAIDVFIIWALTRPGSVLD